ncbi:MAG: hypothetical protein FRX49_02716 [Trebouxia sp. A1-2]|nr:MAG: hypothetical protein FRX49_02716 [Trebouxia sp. A1-2]
MQQVAQDLAFVVTGYGCGGHVQHEINNMSVQYMARDYDFNPNNSICCAIELGRPFIKRLVAVDIMINVPSAKQI